MNHILINTKKQQIKQKRQQIKQIKQKFRIQQRIRMLQQQRQQKQQQQQPQQPQSTINTDEYIKYHYQSINTMTTSSINPKIKPNNFSSSQLISLYNIPIVTKLKPTTRQVVVAIIVAFRCPTVQSDLNLYWKSPINFGPSSKPPTINVYTFPGATVNSGWGLEECLDVQMVAIANPNAKIWVVEAKSDNIIDMYNAVQYASGTINADIISCSWGGSDSNILNGRNSLFINPANTSNYKCFCASSGDNNSVNWPSVLSNVISVGGSTLTCISNLTNFMNRSEYTWTGAGCGYSTSVAIPSYQNSVNTSYYRATPDISLVANPVTGVYVVYNGKMTTVGGTSVACPLFAGILSLANQQRFNVDKLPLTSVYTQTPTSNNKPSSIPSTNVQNFLYKTIYTNSTLKSKCLIDITIGTDGKYSAGNGYDIATGLGSPNVTELCNALALNMS